MGPKEELREQGVEVRRFERDGGVELVADFGPLNERSAEVVDDTVIVIADGDQYDVNLDGDAEAFMNNGLLTIEMIG